MFYSTEILTSRKYGVATIWIVANLGAKSTLKKVTRKAILDVDVQKACQIIVTPEMPMALRLQSNLLYGVARVYSQQCGYVLTDVETARNNMRAMFKLLTNNALETEGGNKGRADNLILPDDPNFLPGLNDDDFLTMKFDHLNEFLAAAEHSQTSDLNPPSSQPRGRSQYIGGLDIPPSTSSRVDGLLSGISRSGIGGDPGTGTLGHGLLEDDFGIEMDEDGTIRISDAPAMPSADPNERKNGTDRVDTSWKATSKFGLKSLGADTDARGEDNEFEPTQHEQYAIDPDDDTIPPQGIRDQAQQTSTTSESGNAPIRRRARPKAKVIPADIVMELRNGDLARWNTDYVVTMHAVIRQKQAVRLVTLARKNAACWVLGTNRDGPLGMFTGARLLEIHQLGEFAAGGQKRARAKEDAFQTGRRVRSRDESYSDEQKGGAQDDELGYPVLDDDTIEKGREAHTPLDDYHLSSILPWNQSTGSRRPTGTFSPVGFSTSAGHVPIGLASRRGSRLVSASPLTGRGTMGDRMDIDELQLPGPQDSMRQFGIDEFERFGVAAQVDTQKAEQSQWQRAMLDGESLNFLEFVQAGIDEMDRGRADTAVEADGDDQSSRGSVDFARLLLPESNSRIVAAQGFLHVLTLSTKNLLHAEQKEPFGTLTLRIIAN